MPNFDDRNALGNSRILMNIQLPSQTLEWEPGQVIKLSTHLQQTSPLYFGYAEVFKVSLKIKNMPLEEAIKTVKLFLDRCFYAA
jgi:hypothetical protein